MLLGVKVDDQLLVDALGDLIPGRDVEILTGEGGGVKLDPGILGSGSHAGLDDLKALGALADGEGIAGLDGGRRDAANLAVERDVTVVHELTSGGSRRSDTGAVHDVVQTGLEEEEEVLTLLTAHAGSLLVGVAELTLEHTIHVLDLLLLLQLNTVVFLFLALAGQSVLSRREIPLLEIFVGTENGLTKLTRDLGAGTSISCHNDLALKVKLYDGLSDGNHCEA